MGPLSDGTGAVHSLPDGTDKQSASFSFGKDTSGGNLHRNLSTPPFPSIGHTGCTEDTAECGPDNEDGRGLFVSGVMDASDWLLLAGSRSGGDLDYVYMTSDTDNTLEFSFVDLAEVLGPQTKGASAMHVFNNRFYAGFPDTGGKRPYFLVFFRTPSPPGLEPVVNGIESACDPALHEVCNLAGHRIPEVGSSAPTSIIDSITDFNDRLYVANNGGLARSTSDNPRDAHTYPGDWAIATPASADYTDLTSVDTDKVAEIEPADKAVPGLCSFGGRLFAARNTSTGPQLWSCAPEVDGGPLDCDPADWSLVAPNTSGDTQLTQFNNSGNTHISLLVASGTHLYLGFDNPDGLHVFRTATPLAATAGDFEGESGCTADQHPGGCAGLGGAGLGGAGLGGADNTRIFSQVMFAGDPASDLYLVVGDGSDPVDVFHIIER